MKFDSLGLLAESLVTRRLNMMIFFPTKSFSFCVVFLLFLCVPLDNDVII